MGLESKFISDKEFYFSLPIQTIHRNYLMDSSKFCVSESKKIVL